MKKVISIFLVVFTIVGCKEKDLTSENPPLPSENVELAVSLLYNKKGFTADSLLTNKKGNKFFIKQVKFLVADFYVVSKGDSFIARNTYFTFDREHLEHLVLELPDGGYSGHYGFRLGLDSLRNTQVLTGNAGKSVEDMFRNDGTGYNAFIISGMAIDPTNANDTAGTIPFSYEIGGPFLQRRLSGNQINFSVTADSQANFILNVDVWPVLNDHNIITRPTVTSDFTNLADFLIAKEMNDSLKVSLF